MTIANTLVIYLERQLRMHGPVRIPLSMRVGGPVGDDKVCLILSALLVSL